MTNSRIDLMNALAINRFLESNLDDVGLPVVLTRIEFWKSGAVLGVG
jgi:hypothetical protein